PRLGNGVAGLVERLLRIPHQALAVEAMPHAGYLAFHLGHVQPALVILLLQPSIWYERRRVDYVALTYERRQQTGLWEFGDVGSVARFHADADRPLEFLAADVLDVDARRLFKGRNRLLELHRVRVRERPVYRHDRAGVFAGQGRFKGATSGERNTRGIRLNRRFLSGCLGGLFRRC